MSKNHKLEFLYETTWLHWRGKAGAYSKSGNKVLRDLSNEQSKRYFFKYAELKGFTHEQMRQYLSINKYT